MSTMFQIREGFSRAWDSLTEGWREFRELAGDALTRFQPSPPNETAPTDNQIVNQASRWGLLAAEVADQGSCIDVMIEVPGLEAEDFQIEVHNDILVVRGEKKLSREVNRGNYHVMERAYGRFERAIRLPAAVEDRAAEASYHAGVLKISLPKSTATTPRTISVRSG